MKQKKEWKKITLRAVKIAVGSSAAIYIAEEIGLVNAVSAGNIALLTLVTTKWETLKLSLCRMFTFGIAVLLAYLTIGWMKSEWIAFGLYIFLLIGISHFVGWQATISVNSVIGIHFLMEKNFKYGFILNELLLVILGITIAIILNLFHDYKNQRNGLIKSMRYTENSLQMILAGVAVYLLGKDMQINVWKAINKLEDDLQEFLKNAYEYQDNTFRSHPEYYINYFEMRYYS